MVSGDGVCGAWEWPRLATGGLPCFDDDTLEQQDVVQLDEA